MAGRTYKEYSSASVSKHAASETWRASLRWREVTEDIAGDGSTITTKGKWHQLTKMTGVRCKLDPKGTPKKEQDNRGRQTALRKAEEWRAALIKADEDAKQNKERMEREAEEARREAERIASERARERTVADYAKTIVERKTGSVEQSTIKGYRFNAKQIADHFGDLLLQELTTDKVAEWKNALLDRYNPTTAKKAYNFLKACMEEALEEGLIDRTPFTRSIRAPKLTQRKPNALDGEGRKRLAAILKGNDTIVGVAATIALYTGMRRGEICALTWENVKIERDEQGNPCGGEIVVCKSIGVAKETYVKETKTNKERTIPVHIELAQALARRKADMEAEALSFGVPFSPSLYVVGKVTGEYRNPDIISCEWAHLAQFLNLRGTQGKIVTFHDLRHTWATGALRAGAKVKDVSAVLGHANAAMTLNVYADAEGEGLEEAVNAIGDSMQGGKAQADVLTLRTGTEG